MTAYARGAKAERDYKKILEDQGYYVTRSAGSHEEADLLACRRIPGLGYERKSGTEVLLVQVKTDKRGPFANFPPRARRALLSEARKAGGKAVLAHNPGDRKGWRTYSPEDWPATGLP